MSQKTVLPVVDITRLDNRKADDRLAVARDLDTACADTGFLYIKVAQIKRPLVNRLLERAKAYFSLDAETKMKIDIGYSLNHRDYAPVGEEYFGNGVYDLKESYDINNDFSLEHGRRPFFGPNIWPEMPEFRDDMLAYYNYLTHIGHRIFNALALALGLDEHHFDDHLRYPPSQLRLIHYPYDATAEDHPGIGAHMGYECFTLLHVTVPDLQAISLEGVWIDVPVLEDSLSMNIGDMMEIMSDGRLMATKHRDIKVMEERYSFPLFFSFDYGYAIQPFPSDRAPKYLPLKGDQHLFNQTAQTFSYLSRRIDSGELALENAMPLDSFRPREMRLPACG